MNELIKKCRYYKDEKECPSSLEKQGVSSIWYHEKSWTEREDIRDETGMNTREYIRVGLEGFNANDGVPISLKALLFNRQSHWTGGYQTKQNIRSEPFQLWILERTIKDAFIVIADDGNGNILQKKNIEFSDFSMDLFKVYLVDKIILLPSEN